MSLLVKYGYDTLYIYFMEKRFRLMIIAHSIRNLFLAT